MCDTNLYLVRQDQEELLMENIDRIYRQGEQLVVRNIFGEEKSVKAKFREANLMKNKIVFEEIVE